MAEKESFYIGQTDTIWGGDCGEVYIADGEKVLVYYAKQLLDDLPSLYEFALREVKSEEEYKRKKWLDFANKIKTHVNNHICKNIYRANRGCMELTGGYIEETIAVDVTTGRKKCAIYVSTFVDKKLNDAPWQYGGTLFEMPSWC